MAPRGTEVMVGMTRDATFGPCVVFGIGGIYAEILNDFAFRIAPISEAEARAMIEETAAAKILKGARGQRPADIAAIVQVLMRLSQLACAHPEIQDIDLNPVFAGPHGVSVVDARIILSADSLGDVPRAMEVQEA
jgi:acetyltransferase